MCMSPAVYKCAYPAPYPEIRVVKQNPYYARLLLEDYAGAVSETSAVMQYTYHHLLLEKQYKEAADLLECISLVEMHHLEMLGSIILMLGVEPRYRVLTVTNEEKYWDASYIYYGSDLCDRISADIAGEWAAITNYRKHQQIIDDPYIKELLERIIMDELHHINLFHQLMQKYCWHQLPQRVASLSNQT
ncbi:bacterioferritin [Desulfofundulus australicus DSM 11792]|uniref:Bacterioferritin n=1 Tax=Desulfofundulus australicus DSM 11792 TaxID=1121425 RepID=A0A1M5BFN0_9FIRM|nr:manganese catalase family protein [Desulfofundulus australicus]SHF41334.1 bacterioferritin [Desulfofundulus australicus DSM 11792]